MAVAAMFFRCLCSRGRRLEDFDSAVAHRRLSGRLRHRSAIEVFAAGVVIRQLRGGGDLRQRRALQLIGVTFYVLAAYMAFESVRDLVTQAKAGESLIGIVLTASPSW